MRGTQPVLFLLQAANLPRFQSSMTPPTSSNQTPAEVMKIVEELQTTLGRAAQWVDIGGDWHFEEAQLDGDTVGRMTPYYEMKDEILEMKEKSVAIAQSFTQVYQDACVMREIAERGTSWMRAVRDVYGKHIDPQNLENLKDLIHLHEQSLSQVANYPKPE